jgi:hypothetical protein
MEFADVVLARRSCRGFLPKLVNRATLKEIFELSRWAPSNCNVQPWHVHVVSGSACDSLRHKMKQRATEDSKGHPDFPWQGRFGGDYKERQICSALGLWQHQGVSRNDRDGRNWSWMRNFEFFGAPHIAFIFVTDEFPELIRFVGDAGMYAQTLMLAMANAGVGSCPQTSVSYFPDLVREQLGIEDSYKLLMGISFGYVDENDSSNHFRTERDSLDKTVTFHDE